MGVLTGAAADLVQRRQCAALIGRFVDAGVWTTQPNSEVLRPSGQLSVAVQIVDVASGSAFDVPGVALDEFSAGPRHAGPGDFAALRFSRPTLAPGETRFVVEGNAYVAASRPADAVSLVLMAASLEAPFSVDPALGATTEWIVALPTRHAYLDDRPGGELPPGNAPISPFDGAGVVGAARCNPVTWEIIARDGRIVGAGDLAPQPAELCAQLTRLRLTRDEPAAAGGLSTRGERNGRLRLGLAAQTQALGYMLGPEGRFSGGLFGLPALAVPLIEARNASAQPGRLATYGFTGHVVRKQSGFVDF